MMGPRLQRSAGALVHRLPALALAAGALAAIGAAWLAAGPLWPALVAGLAA